MTNAEWVKKFGEPEATVGLGVDWSGYIAPGGWAWQEYFQNELEVHTNDLISKLKANLAKADSSAIEFKALLSGAEKAEKFFMDFSKAIKDYPEKVSKVADDGRVPLNEWLSNCTESVRLTRKALISICNTGVGSDRSVDLANIRFAEAMRDYFKKDFEFDMMMWAMHNVDPKYFKKLFRITYRLINGIAGCRNIVENSTCELAVRCRDLFKQQIGALHDAYTTLEPLMRKYKHVVSSPDFVPSRDAIAPWFSKEYENRASNWNIQYGDSDLSRFLGLEKVV